MKITAKQYAQSLFEITEGQEKNFIVNSIKNWLAFIAKRREEKILPNIIVELEKLNQAKEGTLSAKISSARSLSQDCLENITKYLKKKTNAKNIVWQKEENSDLLGGVMISYEDKIIDITLKNQIIKLSNKING